MTSSHVMGSHWESHVEADLLHRNGVGLVELLVISELLAKLKALHKGYLFLALIRRRRCP